jgi:hypothetical protein
LNQNLETCPSYPKNNEQKYNIYKKAALYPPIYINNSMLEKNSRGTKKQANKEVFLPKNFWI